MFKRILPAHVDNRFRGHALALSLFAPLALMKLLLGLAHVLRADGGAQSVSTMPLDTYPAGAAQNIIALMARMWKAPIRPPVILEIPRSRISNAGHRPRGLNADGSQWQMRKRKLPRISPPRGVCTTSG